MREKLLIGIFAILILAAPWPCMASTYNAPNLLDEVRDFADIMRMNGREIPEWLDDPALTKVTREFGPTIIPMGHLPIKSEIAVGTPKPWSSWWFPKKEDRLFHDIDPAHLSVLTKYDMVRRAIYQKAGKPAPSSAALFEKMAYNPRSLSWEGLCDAWAIAAISIPEPTRPITLSIGSKSITFSVGEQKALLLKTFEAINDSDLNIYGQKFTGDSRGWIFPDIFPDQFHRFLEIQLFKRKQAFFMDHDPGIQVWSVPVFKANYTVSAIAGDPNAVLVQAWVFSAEPSEVDQIDLVGSREAVREYNYILKGARNANNDLVVSSGYWIKGADGVDSRQDHPDYVVQIPEPGKIARKSWNPEIEAKIVDKILFQARTAHR
jgi:hypothetical protein